MKNRKVIGLFLFLAFVVIYSFAAMLLAVHVLPDNKWAELAFYPIVGVVWIFPAMKIVRLMLPGDETE
ncbi:hypothetical protein A9Q83_00260 [Alphaproteobacteria bacterium 46_93_T64]|nr:hypothetical protein A9Q83_00260 [Alphaproteobacteria bacterium 46_93_T64]